MPSLQVPGGTFVYRFNILVDNIFWKYVWRLFHTNHVVDFKKYISYRFLHWYTAIFVINLWVI